MQRKLFILVVAALAMLVSTPYLQNADQVQTVEAAGTVTSITIDSYVPNGVSDCVNNPGLGRIDFTVNGTGTITGAVTTLERLAIGGPVGTPFNYGITSYDFTGGPSSVTNAPVSSGRAIRPVPEGTIIEFWIKIDNGGQITESERLQANCSNGALLVDFVGALDAAGDKDSDGVANSIDNCPRIPNADQLDTFGGSSGDACDNGNFTVLGGVSAFQQKDGRMDFYADCFDDGFGNTRCKTIARVSPGALSPGMAPALFDSAGEDLLSDWRVVVEYLGTDTNGYEVYRAATIDGAGNVIDDTLRILKGPGFVGWTTVDAPNQVLGRISLGGETTTTETTQTTGTGADASPSFSANDSVRPGDRAVSIGAVRVRVAPSLDAAETGLFAQWGQCYTILEEDASGFWFKIEVDGVIGWASNEWFELPGVFVQRGGGTVPPCQ